MRGFNRQAGGDAKENYLNQARGSRRKEAPLWKSNPDEWIGGFMDDRRSPYQSNHPFIPSSSIWALWGVERICFFSFHRLNHQASAMNSIRSLLRTPNRRIAAIAAVVLALDQITKAIVLHFLPYDMDERMVLPGFFKLVHWQNTGAAWSSFTGKNGLLALIAIAALIILFFSRHHFNSHTVLGQFAFGLVIGGIMGNLADRVFRHYVVDFLRFYLQPRGGYEITGFPAFNVADSAICVGVTLVFLMTWRNEHTPKPAESPSK
jgi:signal peptidase II